MINENIIFLIVFFFNVTIAAELSGVIPSENTKYKFIIDGIPFYIPLDSEMSMNGDQTDHVTIIISLSEDWVARNNIKGPFLGGAISIYLLNSNQANKLVSERSHFKSIEVNNSEYVQKCSYLVVENITSLTIHTINNVVTYAGPTVLLEKIFDLSSYCGISKLE